MPIILLLRVFAANTVAQVYFQNKTIISQIILETNMIAIIYIEVHFNHEALTTAYR